MKKKYPDRFRFGLLGSFSFLPFLPFFFLGSLVSEGTYDSISLLWRALSFSAFSFHCFLSASDMELHIAPAAFMISVTFEPFPPNCLAMISLRPTSFIQMK